MKKKQTIRERVEWEVGRTIAIIDSYCLCLTDGNHGLDDANAASIKHELIKTFLSLFSEILGGLEMKKMDESTMGLTPYPARKGWWGGHNQAVKEFNSKIEKIRKELK